MRIAMWSGPRNLSTAMMYAFGNRADFAAWDEPFYAAYLKESGIDHPMRDAILAGHECDPDKVAARCAGPIPGGKPHFYMKHMALHMEGFPMDWAAECVNIHLIRHPARVVASYAAKRESPTFHDIGFQQQADVFERFPGPVVDSADIRRDPEGMLHALCDAVGLAFDPAMLAWPSGPKSFDGVWAAHWYETVHCSTGFAGAEGPLPKVDGCATALIDEALPFYERLRTVALS
ncbi:MAG: HAD family hydrolase [Silicimonas sp.]|nr:HAD family hydrolase [Silicimonas sp.]